MANKRAYEIAFVGLKPGLHEFRYDLDEKFFLERGVTDLEHPQAQIKMLLDKNAGFMLLTFEIGGSAGSICDRCGNPLKLDLWDEFKMLVKLVDNPVEMNEQEEDPDVFYISRNESHLDVENWLYEFVLLSVPMQKVCANDENGRSTCNEEVLEKLKIMKESHNETLSNSIWKGLDKFKGN
ncbi:MAG: hypothetical protein RIR96_28 [Bacteroidota bacterium]|jgi:uncharacterized metal-binding protein YceD (DUF177 family)